MDPFVVLDPFDPPREAVSTRESRWIIQQLVETIAVEPPRERRSAMKRLAVKR